MLKMSQGGQSRYDFAHHLVLLPRGLHHFKYTPLV